MPKKNRDKSVNESSQTIPASPQMQRMLDSYQRDYLELTSYHQYKEAPWAYYYAFPEYFEPSHMPGTTSVQSYMTTEPTMHHPVAGPQGTLFIHFCPGAIGTFLAANPALGVNNGLDVNGDPVPPNIMQPAAWLAWSSDVSQAGFTHVARGTPGEAHFDSARCIGGYMIIETGPSNSGLVKYRQYVRGTADPNTVTNMEALVDPSAVLKGNMVFRYRVAQYDDLLNTGVHADHLAYDIFIYGLEPNTPVTLSTVRTFQGKLNQLYPIIKYIKPSTHADFSIAKREVKHLLERFPKELTIRPLDDPLFYHRFLFDNIGIKKSLFPIKNRTPHRHTPVTLPNIANLDLNIIAGNANIMENVDPNVQAIGHGRRDNIHAIEPNAPYTNIRINTRMPAIELNPRGVPNLHYLPEHARDNVYALTNHAHADRRNIDEPMMMLPNVVMNRLRDEEDIRHGYNIPRQPGTDPRSRYYTDYRPDPR